MAMDEPDFEFDELPDFDDTFDALSEVESKFTINNSLSLKTFIKEHQSVDQNEFDEIQDIDEFSFKDE